MVQTRAKRSPGKEPIKRAASVVSLFVCFFLSMKINYSI
jgi:hypothetical protein